jgi:hypothetical protein
MVLPGHLTYCDLHLGNDLAGYALKDDNNFIVSFMMKLIEKQKRLFTRCSAQN